MRQNVTMWQLMRWRWLPAALGGIAVGVCLALAPAPAEDAGEARPVVGEVRIVVQQALWPASGRGVPVIAAPFMRDAAEDRVFSLRPEVEGGGPLSAAQLLRRGGSGYA